MAALTEEDLVAAERSLRQFGDESLDAGDLAYEIEAWERQRAFYLADIDASYFSEHDKVTLHNGIAYADVRLAELRQAATRHLRAMQQPGFPKARATEDLSARFAAAKYCDLVDVAQTLTAQQARKRGNSWWIRCPFHKNGAERTPSLEILLPGKGWRCHACHIGGDAVNFVARLRGLGNAKALFFLEEITDTCPTVWEAARRG
jgi:hypothetical protein